MSIQVIYKNGNKGIVTSDMLDYLLETDAILSFKREDGWVRPGCDPLRDRDTLVFSIPERRSSMAVLLETQEILPTNEMH